MSIDGVLCRWAAVCRHRWRGGGRRRARYSGAAALVATLVAATSYLVAAAVYAPHTIVAYFSTVTAIYPATTSVSPGSKWDRSRPSSPTVSR
ncbi:hypothetical protein BN970_03523 [Mycolicibacterium conceptionense]|uniref:Uncharacterized protein n=1 Tax=Mycolicibacterium conceptionense TaxID=451644 RepID=A0A0U1DHT1_9MYCO|nr:hypothetical protein BN970_03523 [Mycolicibacterium conceptionense]